MKNIYHYLKNTHLKFKQLTEEYDVLTYLLAAILITIPLNFAFGSITCILFFIVALFSVDKSNFHFNKVILLPMILYCIMVCSLFWTKDFNATVSGLQKDILFLLMPLAFFFIIPLKKSSLNKVFRLYGFGMCFYTLYYFSNALIRYFSTGNRNVFFFHELVTVDLNAIYMAAFASFGMFYFISIKNKTIIDRICIFTLLFFVFLLSSKSVFFIDLLLIVCYYSFFSKTPTDIKALTIISVFFFSIFSILFVERVREQFLMEYETAFVDNTINENFGTKTDVVYNVSLKQAWSNEKFQPNNFFPGTALRVFQVRIFTEMLAEQNIVFSGFGHEASQQEIEKKITQHQLNLGYRVFNFHNQYVQTFAELGVFGFIVFTVMLFLNLKNAISGKNLLHLVFAVTMIVLLLTESIFCRQRGIVFFITLFCIFNTINYKDQTEFK
ncbi:O-antigen ligase-like membrane protein [Flavobacterium cauense R2A-7]|uniref:O-antigen ligase-like membrane protein n=2 Tax=Flavobacterium TaxID=237 RepID=A0A562M053_9FLAO|nr:hypothetical protein Q762_08955 [Flavobacterium cauense R2A-7]TWI13213.1 O-antigen ligase-like membrane protein [Flavobacterium cauense R2A-7]